MKSKKLDLRELQVKSFVTNYDAEASKTVKGGLLSIGEHCTHAHNGCYGTKHSKGLFCNPH